MKYSKDDYDKLAETGTLDEVQKMYYEGEIILSCRWNECLLQSLLKINRKDEIMCWIFKVEPLSSMLYLGLFHSPEELKQIMGEVRK